MLRLGTRNARLFHKQPVKYRPRLLVLPPPNVLEYRGLTSLTDGPYSKTSILRTKDVLKDKRRLDAPKQTGLLLYSNLTAAG